MSKAILSAGIVIRDLGFGNNSNVQIGRLDDLKSRNQSKASVGGLALTPAVLVLWVPIHKLVLTFLSLTFLFCLRRRFVSC